MIYEVRTATLKNGIEVVLRSPKESDAKEFADFREITSGETHFMARNAGEIDTSSESSKRRINSMRESENALEIAAFVGGELAGSCGITGKFNHQKLSHRASFGISIKKKFWGMGLGSLLLETAIEESKKLSIEQLELGVFSDNERAQHLYKKFGFCEYGRLPNAYKLLDGTYRDEIAMVCFLK